MINKFILIGLAIFCLSCGDTIVAPTITPSPSPSPDPLVCTVNRVRIVAKLDTKPGAIYAWAVGQIAVLEAVPLNNLDQALEPDCAYDRTATWRFLGSADCKPQGDSAGLVIRAVCDGPGALRTEVDINGILGVADFDVIS